MCPSHPLHLGLLVIHGLFGLAWNGRVGRVSCTFFGVYPWLLGWFHIYVNSLNSSAMSYLPSSDFLVSLSSWLITVLCEQIHKCMWAHMLPESWSLSSTHCYNSWNAISDAVAIVRNKERRHMPPQRFHASTFFVACNVRWCVDTDATQKDAIHLPNPNLSVSNTNDFHAYDSQAI